MPTPWHGQHANQFTSLTGRKWNPVQHWGNYWLQSGGIFSWQNLPWNMIGHCAFYGPHYNFLWWRPAPWNDSMYCSVASKQLITVVSTELTSLPSHGKYTLLTSTLDPFWRSMVIVKILSLSVCTGWLMRPMSFCTVHPAIHKGVPSIVHHHRPLTHHKQDNYHEKHLAWIVLPSKAMFLASEEVQELCCSQSLSHSADFLCCCMICDVDIHIHSWGG